ncbi:MAG: hydrolase family protein [Microbacteriaceae bacterium]|jgi:acyl-CoA thioesterase-1|nr:hydrolase family protein [Microbacteriaceae bacterium]
MAAVALVVPGAFGVGSIVQRRQRGVAHIAGTLHLNARWWREEGEKSGDLLYVAVGDSAAQGVGASRPGHSYVGLLANHIRDKTGHSVRVVNLSVSGARLRDAMAVQVPALRALKPDIVTVAVGANDMASFDRDRFESELGELLDALPSGTIVADLPSFFLGPVERNARVANAIVRTLADRHGFEVAPLHATTRRQGAAWYALNRVSVDFFHPNDRGYKVWAAAFLPVLDRWMARLAARRKASDGGLA